MSAQVQAELFPVIGTKADDDYLEDLRLSLAGEALAEAVVDFRGPRRFLAGVVSLGSGSTCNTRSIEGQSLLQWASGSCVTMAK